MTDPGPETDDRHPADVVTGMVNHVLDLAATWPRWDGRPVEVPAEDLDEARSRLRRLALIWDVRLRSLSDQHLDERAGDAWTLRQLTFHVAESAFYADSVGMLAR